MRPIRLARPALYVFAGLVVGVCGIWLRTGDRTFLPWPGLHREHTVSASLIAQLLADPSARDLWQRLGDSYAAEPETSLATGCHEIAFLLKPSRLSRTDGPIREAATTLQRLKIQDDELVGRLADAAVALGERTAARELYVLAATLDGADLEWREKAAAIQPDQP